MGIGPARSWGRDHLRSRSRGANSIRQPHGDRVFALLNPLEVSQFPPSPILEPRILGGGFPCRAGPRVERRHSHRPAAFSCPLRSSLRLPVYDLHPTKPLVQGGCTSEPGILRFRFSSSQPALSGPATPRKTSSAHKINASQAPTRIQSGHREQWRQPPQPGHSLQPKQ